MQTPYSAAGRLTEEVMSRWLRRLELRKEPRPSTATYNAAWESVHEILTTCHADLREASRGR